MKSVAVGKNWFRWPAYEDQLYYQDDEILCIIEPPTPVNRRGDYCLSHDNFEEANRMLQKII